MKRKEDERESIPSRLPAKFAIKAHQIIKVDPILPLDLEYDILTRLPSKSLMRFLCVSKKWYSLFRSQRFILSHYNAMSSMSRSPRFLIVFGTPPAISPPDSRMFIFSASEQDQTRSTDSSSSSLATNLEMTIPSITLCPGSNCTSVHGLLACYMSGNFTFCNPSTRKLATFHPSRMRTSLGYDPVLDQVKALTLVSDVFRAHRYLVHEVLTLGGGGDSSLWKPNVVASLPYETFTRAVSINGFLYWGAFTRVTGSTTRDKTVIVCFDVRQEKFRFIKAPDAIEYQPILIDYKGKLAFIVRELFTPFLAFSLWILEEDDWSMQTFQLPFSIVDQGRYITSPGTNGAGDIIFCLSHLSHETLPFYIYYYNVERKDIKKVRLLGIADTQEFRHPTSLINHPVFVIPQHVESVVSL